MPGALPAFSTICAARLRYRGAQNIWAATRRGCAYTCRSTSKDVDKTKYSGRTLDIIKSTYHDLIQRALTTCLAFLSCCRADALLFPTYLPPSISQQRISEGRRLRSGISPAAPALLNGAMGQVAHEGMHGLSVPLKTARLRCTVS